MLFLGLLSCSSQHNNIEQRLQDCEFEIRMLNFYQALTDSIDFWEVILLHMHDEEIQDLYNKINRERMY